MQSVLDFWFDEIEPSARFKRSDERDNTIKERFEGTFHAVLRGETDDWRDTAEGRLAEIIVLDQFSRNMFRGSAQAFSGDALALALSQELIRRGWDTSFDDERRSFAYMPFMHSESAVVHVRALQLFADLPNLNYEIAHKEIIDRFGRYPHRNAALGRTSTPEEIEWMKNHKGF